jgi:hypothetical protein
MGVVFEQLAKLGQPQADDGHRTGLFGERIFDPPMERIAAAVRHSSQVSRAYQEGATGVRDPGLDKERDEGRLQGSIKAGEPAENAELAAYAQGQENAAAEAAAEEAEA